MVAGLLRYRPIRPIGEPYLVHNTEFPGAYGFEYRPSQGSGHYVPTHAFTRFVNFTSLVYLSQFQRFPIAERQGDDRGFRPSAGQESKIDPVLLRFKHVPHRYSIHARGLHGHAAHFMLLQPVAQCLQAVRESRECLPFDLDFAPSVYLTNTGAHVFLWTSRAAQRRYSIFIVVAPFAASRGRVEIQ